MENINDSDVLISAIENISFVMLGTIDNSDTIHARPMAALSLERFHEDQTLWFFTKRNSNKVSEIENDSRVSISYVDQHHNRFASVCGEAFLSEDPELIKAYWKSNMKTWFPTGPEDPDLALIGVRVKSAQIWDASNTSFHQMIGFVKSTLTGKPFDLDVDSTQINWS